MDVKIKPLSGCMKITLGVLTLGLAPFFLWLNSRNWPKHIDEKGLVTHNDKLHEWFSFTKIIKVITRGKGGSVLSEHYELKHPNGKVIVAPYRLENGDQVLDYIWQHLPEQVRQPQ